MELFKDKFKFHQDIELDADLIDINGKNAHHIQDLYFDLKKKDETIQKLLTRINEKREENFKLQTIIKSQSEKNLAEYHFPESVDN